MAHSLIRCWLHALWATKDRQPLILPSIEKMVYRQIEAELRSQNCFTSIVNGMPDHVHVLFMLNPRISISDTFRQVKGCTSHWINHNNLISQKFAWQTGLEAHSVSESQVQRVYNYIKHQKIHHNKKTFQEELETLGFVETMII